MSPWHRAIDFFSHEVFPSLHSFLQSRVERRKTHAAGLAKVRGAPRYSDLRRHDSLLGQQHVNTNRRGSMQEDRSAPRPLTRRENRKPKTLKQYLALFCLTWGGIGFIALLPGAFRYAFLPSAEWVEVSKPYWFASGIFTAAVFFMAIWITPPNQFKRAAFKDSPPTPFEAKIQKTFGLPLMSLMGFLCGKATVVIAIPMVAATLAGLGGMERELPFTVSSGVHHNNRGCGYYIYLGEAPFFYDRICGIKDVREMTGEKILVGGHGTSMGIWAKYTRASD
jgi:hypothetical protein